MREKTLDKGNLIEMKDRGETNSIRMTPEESRKIVPREVRNLRFILDSYSNMNKYSWENDASKIINGEKVMFTREEKKILRFLLLQRIPDKYRGDYWMIASGARLEMKNNPNYYTNLVDNFPLFVPSPYENQIMMDLHRTFPSDPFFKKEENIKKLNNILIAYSHRNISIGYCQGFNFIVGRLLKIFPKEEEAFWMFVQIIENILPLNYYSELAGIMIDCTILIKLIKVYLPSLQKNLASIGYDMSLNNLIYKWLVSAFIQNLSYDLSLIVWDFLFLEGNIVIFKASLAILKIIKSTCIKNYSIEEINYTFDEETKHLNDYNTLIFYLRLKKYEFDKEFINKYRTIFYSSVCDNIIKNNQYRINLIKKKEEEDKKNQSEIKSRASFVKDVFECDRNWPICIFDLNYKYKIVEYLVFKVHDNPYQIENYFFEQFNNNYYCSVNTGKNNFRLRKSSRSSEHIFKLNIKTNNNLSNNKNSGLDLRIKSVRNFPKTSLSFASDDHLRYYKNLLIERRNHLCPGIETQENCNDYSFELEDEIEDKLDDKSTIMLDKKRIKKAGKVIKSSKKRSKTIMKSPYFRFSLNNTSNENYQSLIYNLNKDKFEQENKNFETLRPKKFMDIDEYD